ncbi:MAG: hypothetical protein ACFBQW_04435 [Sphingomonadaceae bacterium]
MRTLYFSFAAFAAALSLAACGDSGQAPEAEPETEKAPAENISLPPTIAETRTYRCRDNSLVYVNIMSDGTTVNVRSLEDEPPRATLTREAEDEPFTGEGYYLSGTGDEITFESPDVPRQSCHV